MGVTRFLWKNILTLKNALKNQGLTTCNGTVPKVDYQYMNHDETDDLYLRSST